LSGVSSSAWGESNEQQRIARKIAAIEFGCEEVDGAPFREHFLDFDGAKCFESGGQNIGLGDLVVNHLQLKKEML
jgi:hypothetical protein